jgi:hypothetical protein
MAKIVTTDWIAPEKATVLNPPRTSDTKMRMAKPHVEALA